MPTPTTPKRGGWHTHLILDSARIDQGELVEITSRHRGLDDVKVNLLRLPGEALSGDRILRQGDRRDFRCPEAEQLLFETSTDHLDYVAAQPLDAPPGCTLWVEQRPRGEWTRFRDALIADLRAGRREIHPRLASVTDRRSAFAPARRRSLRQEGRHRDLWQRDSTSLRLYPGRGRLRRIDLHTLPCPVCGLDAASHGV